MPTIKTLPRKVNFDDDIRTLQPDEARSATNMRFYSSQSSESMAAENIPSTEEIAISGKPAGANKCIGSISHPEKNDLYSFYWNENKDHFITRFNTITNKTYLVLKNDLLKFSKTSFVNGFAVTGNSGDETLLYWTDDINQPRQINVRKAELHTAGNYINGYPNPLTEEYIRWVKYQPTNAPTITWGQDDSIVYNNISENIFQFRYRWRHKDGQYTAYSPVSNISVSEIQASNNAFFTQKDFVYNYIDVTVENGNKEVDKIEIIVREGNTGEWLLFKTIENDYDGSPQVVRFYNDDTYTIVNNEDALKNYDAVPLKAKTVEYIASRAVLGNAVDGYDSLPQTQIDDSVTFGARYLPNKDVQPTNIAYTKSSFPMSASITYDTSVLTSIDAGDTILIQFKHSPVFVGGNNNWYFEWVAEAGDDITDFLAAASSYFLNKQVGTVKCTTVSTVGNDLYLLLELTYTSVIDMSIYDESSIYIELAQGSLSFKAGAKHPLGIVYYDEAGRSGTVQKKTDAHVYCKWFSERDTTFEGGRAVIDWRIGLTPPVWAKTYQIVYGGNSSVGDFIQYTIAGVYVDISTKAKGSNKNIYVTLNNLFGTSDSHPDSYTTSRGALMRYSFKEGDRLRIIKKPKDDELADREKVTDYLDFKIVGFEYFSPSTDENPFYVTGGTNTRNRFGWTLILENPEVAGWGYDDVDGDIEGASSENEWVRIIDSTTATHTALVEIYNPTNKTLDGVFYEFGEEYDILDAGLSTRRHDGYRPQGTNIVAKTVAAIDATETYIELDYGKVKPTIFVGDVIVFTSVNANTPDGEYTVTRKMLNTTTNRWRFYTTGSYGSATISDVSTVTISEDYLFACGTLENGDVWYKPRLLITGTIGIESTPTATASTRTTIVENVEDYYANDFFKSDSWNKGRAHVYSPYAKQQRRKATIWVSEPMFPEDNTNGLSAFNLSAGDLPFIDYDRSYGSIQLLKRGDERLYIYQENKVSFVMAGQAVLKQADDNTVAVITGEILQPTQTTYAGDFGICENPESHAQDGYGRHYFVDIKRGKALRLSADGLTPISDYKVASFFDEKSKEYMSVINSGNLKIYGGFDREYEEYNITFEAVTYGDVVIGGEEPTSSITIGKASDDGTNVVIEVGIQASENVPTVQIVDPDTLGDATVDKIYLDSIASTNIVNISTETFDKLLEDELIPIGVEDSNGAVLSATLELDESRLLIKKDNEMELVVGFQETDTIESITLVFHEPSNSWCGYRSYTPTGGYGSINYQFFSYHNDDFWRHGTGDDFNTFHGTAYSALLSPVLNGEPTRNKVLKSISLESTKAFDITSITSNLCTTSFDKERFEEMEGIWYADVPMATTTQGGEKYYRFGVGSVASVSGNNIVFANSIQDSGMRVGDSIYRIANLYTTTVTAINHDTNTVTVAAIGSIVANDVIFVQRTAKTEGEPMRGNAFVINMADDTTTLTRVFAVNGNVFESKKTLND